MGVTAFSAGYRFFENSGQIVVNGETFFSLCRLFPTRCKDLRRLSTGPAWNVGVCHSIQLSYGRIYKFAWEMDWLFKAFHLALGANLY